MKSSSSSQKNFLPLICDSNLPQKNCLGGWFYKIEKKTSEKNSLFVKNHNWNFIFITTNIKTQKGKNLLKENSLFLNKNNISIHLMCLEDTFYIDEPKKAYEEISEILKYVNEEKINIKGIHIDCEPHAREDWKNGTNDKKNEIFNNYLKVIEYGRKAINEFKPNITYSGAVAWWYSNKVKNKELNFGRGFDLVNKDRFDFIVPMIYDGAGGSVKKVIERSNDYFNDNVGVVIGISVKDYDYLIFNNVIEEIKNIRASNQFFYGISIFANHYYPDWDDF